jgi:putative inorganic carbon (HCO3(-)) transporter
MRDLLILVLLTAGCLYSIKAPWVGAIMWTVVSLGSPHIHFGYAASTWPVSLVIAASTLLGLVLTRERQNPFSNLAVTMTALLMVWMTISYVYSFEPDLCYETWDRTLKIMVMLVVTISLLDSKQKLYAFIWANVVSVGFYGVKGGIFSIKTGGNYIILGSGGFIAENNNLALAEIVILPLLYFLLTQTTKKWPRRAMMASMVLIAISVLVSHSRGALLGLIAMFSYFWIKSDRKVLWGAIFFVGALVALFALPDDYWQRMNTITSYDEDGSAQGRINSWWVAYNVANDRITGGGYRLNVGWVFAKYAPNPRIILDQRPAHDQSWQDITRIGLGCRAWQDGAGEHDRLCRQRRLSQLGLVRLALQRDGNCSAGATFCGEATRSSTECNNGTCRPERKAGLEACASCASGSNAPSLASVMAFEN